jgi:hypothetical protein
MIYHLFPNFQAIETPGFYQNPEKRRNNAKEKSRNKRVPQSSENVKRR